ncbi:MAG: AF1514 family protein [Desulfobulbaceae bacterium]|nr:AF1514 family protein [Desulfobulbaceae bacterium]
MKEIRISLDGMEINFETAKAMTKALAQSYNLDTDLLAWQDRKKKTHSPPEVNCDTEEFKGWEEYGRHHGGRWEMRINNGEYTMIYS